MRQALHVHEHHQQQQQKPRILSHFSYFIKVAPSPLPHLSQLFNIFPCSQAICWWYKTRRKVVVHPDTHCNRWRVHWHRYTQLERLCNIRAWWTWRLNCTVRGCHLDSCFITCTTFKAVQNNSPCVQLTLRYTFNHAANVDRSSQPYLDCMKMDKCTNVRV